jgi:hypothetical protein
MASVTFAAPDSGGPDFVKECYAIQGATAIVMAGIEAKTLSPTQFDQITELITKTKEALLAKSK